MRVFLIIICCCFQIAQAQSIDTSAVRIMVYNGSVGLTWRLSNSEEFKNSDILVIDSDSLFDLLVEKEDEVLIDRPNFNETILLVQREGGDCHMSVETDLTVDSTGKKVDLTVYNIWGGCRAGGSKTVVVFYPRPEKGTHFHYHRVLLEHRDELEHYGFTSK